MVCARQPTEDESTYAMLHDFGTWRNILLPIKNRKQRDELGFPRLGVVGHTEVPGELLAWYDHNLFDGLPEKLPIRISADDLIAAGWVVD